MHCSYPEKTLVSYNSSTIFFNTFAMAVLLSFLSAFLPGLSSEGVADSQMIDWRNCRPAAKLTRGGECGRVLVPLRWEKPNGPKIELSLRRYRRDGATQGQLWLLDGGPGGDGSFFANPQFLPLFAEAGYDIYILSHRGTGRSTPLSCKGYEEDPKRCANELINEWGTGLTGFRSTEAGRDLGEMIQMTRKPGDRIAIYAISYGTYWAQRYLQHFPEQADAIVLDGILDLQAPVWRNGILANQVGLRLIEQCKEDTTCGTKLTPNPQSALRRAFRRFRTGQCLGGLDLASAFDIDAGRHDALAQALEFIMTETYEERALIPALIYRLARCNPNDQREIVQMFQTMVELVNEQDSAGDGDNAALGLTVAALDLLAWKKRIPVKRLAGNRLFFAENTVREAAFVKRLFPAFRVSYNHFRQSKSDVPMLILQGDLDFQTIPSWGRRLARHFNGVNQHYVRFPQAGHGVIANSPLEDGSQCGMRLTNDFLRDPFAELDTSCINEIIPIDFAGDRAGTQEIARQYFGTDELYPE